jgi:hypothetical protein
MGSSPLSTCTRAPHRSISARHSVAIRAERVDEADRAAQHALHAEKHHGLALARQLLRPLADLVDALRRPACGLEEPRVPQMRFLPLERGLNAAGGDGVEVFHLRQSFRSGPARFHDRIPDRVPHRVFDGRGPVKDLLRATWRRSIDSTRTTLGRPLREDAASFEKERRRRFADRHRLNGAERDSCNACHDAPQPARGGCRCKHAVTLMLPPSARTQQRARATPPAPRVPRRSRSRPSLWYWRRRSGAEREDARRGRPQDGRTPARILEAAR